MTNMARSDYEAHDLAETADHRIPAQLCNELGNGIDPVLQREHCRLGPDQGLHRAGPFGNLPGFDAYNYQVNRPNFVHLSGSFRRINHEIAVEAINRQTPGLDGAQMFSARDKN